MRVKSLKFNLFLSVYVSLMICLISCESDPIKEKMGGEVPSAISAGEEPAGEEPAGEGPAGEEPAGEGPAGEEPAGEEPAGEEPAGEEPAGEEPAGEEPAGEEPAGEEPAGEEPAGEEPAGEEPAGEEPAGEEPAGEEPAGEEPAGEAVRSDEDDDGVIDSEDNCPTVANFSQGDLDDDGVGDVCDNCPTVPNADQLDSDQDEIGNLCDDLDGIDTDGDGIIDAQDCEPTLPEVPGPIEIPNNGIDDDCDGQVDFPPCVDDEFEVIVSNGNPATASSVSDGNTTGVQFRNLILCPLDEDWYKITLQANDGIEVDVMFDALEGDLDLYLYRLNGGMLTPEGLTLITSSSRVGSEKVVYSARAPVRDTYFIKIVHHGSGAQPLPYQMTVNIFNGCTDDAIGPSGEQNDTAAHASNLPLFHETRQICDYDPDWYRFTLTTPQRVRLDVLFDHSEGDIDAQLFDASGTRLVMFGSSMSDNEVLDSDTRLPAGEYLLNIRGVQDVSNRYRVFKSRGVIVTSNHVDESIYPISDAGVSPSVFLSDVIQFPNVPAGAIVSQLKIIVLDINHQCLTDLSVKLLWDGEPVVTLWNRDGEACFDNGLDDDGNSSECAQGLLSAGWNGRLGNDLCLDHRSYPEFAGLDARGELTLEVKDFTSTHTGSVANMHFELQYFLP